jgi:hypothetical protein
MKQKAARVEQLTFDRLLGGRRKGGGRKKSPSSGVSHLKRAEVSGRVPVHVTARVVEGFPCLRQPLVRELFLRCCKKARERPGRSQTGWFHLAEFSLQGTHFHLLVEASDRKTLARALNGLFVRFARGLNKLFRRKGKVFADRYHDRLLRTPREVYNAIRYLFENARKHGEALVMGRPDPYSSGLWFSGWKDYVHDGWFGKEGPVAKATSWLLTQGWRRYGLLDLRPAWDRRLNPFEGYGGRAFRA